MSVASILKNVPLPEMLHINYSFHALPPCDFEHELKAKIREKGVLKNIKKGARIGITAGSRGIANLPVIIRELVLMLKEAGAEPFVFPAMGSHGGAAAEGQRKVLEKYGVTEEFVGCEIISSMETVQIGTTEKGLPVYMDKYAWECDGVVVLNRVKPHTSFRGRHESGIVKMLVIGMGKQKGAEICHQLGFAAMGENIAEIAKVVLASGKILFGVGVVENPEHQTCHTDIALPEEFFAKDAEMLDVAWENFPRLPFAKADVLVIDEIGKEISGTGFDNNVVGRFPPSIGSKPKIPIEITRIAVLRISEKTGGNGNGIGRADITTRELFIRFVFDEAYPNSLTSTAVESVKMPMVLDNDELAIKAAVKTSMILDYSRVKMARIKNTSHLEDIWVSRALYEEVKGHPCVRLTGEEFRPIEFDENGNIK